MSSPFATPKKLDTDALLHPPGSAVGIAQAAANEAKGKEEIDDVQARFAPCFLTFVHRVHSRTFQGGTGAPRFLAIGWYIGIRVDRVMSARDVDAGA